jgi:hypothetical protein
LCAVTGLFAGAAGGCSLFGDGTSLEGTACMTYGAETCDGPHAVAVCGDSPDCSSDTQPCTTFEWRDLSCGVTHSCITLDNPAMCLPDSTDRTCVAGPAIGTFPASSGAVADFNADGVPDFVAADDTSTWIELSGTGGFTSAWIGDTGGIPLVADVDGDGVLDIVVTQSPNGMPQSDTAEPQSNITVAVAKGLGGGAFGPLVSQVIASDVTATKVLAVADVDGDHLADLVVGVERVDPGPTYVSFPPTLALRVYRGASPGGFVTTPVESPLSEADTACKVDGDLVWDWVTAAGDVDGDGRTDVALVTCSGVAIALANRGEATFTEAATTGLGVPASGGPDVMQVFGLLVSDVDGDGRVDLLAPRSNATLGFWRGMGDGSFAPVVGLASLPDPPYQAFVADINGDGRPDVIAQGNSLSGVGDSTVEVLLGNASGIGDVPHVFAPLASAGALPALVAVIAAPPGGKGTFVLTDPGGELHLVTGACQ